MASALLALPHHLPAQQSGSPAASELTVDDVLAQVHKNYLTYYATIPNIFADEHIVSNFLARDNFDGRGGINSSIDSVFRLRRSEPTAKHISLIESREVIAVDHRRPADNQATPLPDMVVGAFSYAAGFLSPALKDCYDYKLEYNRRLKKVDVLIVTYAEKPHLSADTPCSVKEPNAGRAFIDPQTMQIVRLEQKRTEHELSSGSLGNLTKASSSASSSANDVPAGLLSHSAELPADNGNTNGIAPGTLGTWVWSIDYAPVEINGKSFWLPKTINSATSTNTGRSMNWSFTSTYKNYHLLTVNSVIVPRAAMQSKQ
jgi:hypothetical protein